ncbi:hypothetical protein Rvan_3176 [Rhodomicrobium vannielii ATCC 17100]|jgi:hypothetical protein|uniref:Uncharacterized protein n=1 Tax=Rhodomicrobium vannielii (strain ATCC 17100 / DSM 162 / LMG 4299 / NCIMB 10020 / ATH 3.1.1) TaxID=648757 RepID=E3I1J7_RHOVT|nr:hypothetical protein [Rhodomicrobium vannielii]ADP72372.1 hypothetical protein Rvan_3176 [Rhodomicrobium vannielii ATCC 17100]
MTIDMFESANFSFAGIAHARARERKARHWIEAAVAAGTDPHIQQQGMSSGELAGEWLLRMLKSADTPGRTINDLPESLWLETFIILESMGRIEFAERLMPWHGNLFPDDASPRAIALRARIARRVLNMELTQFYAPCGISIETALLLEKGSSSLREEDLDVLCEGHILSSDWLFSGQADEIEA